jgi:hypothetical protein
VRVEVWRKYKVVDRDIFCFSVGRVNQERKMWKAGSRDENISTKTLCRKYGDLFAATVFEKFCLREERKSEGQDIITLQKTKFNSLLQTFQDTREIGQITSFLLDSNLDSRYS